MDCVLLRVLVGKTQCTQSEQSEASGRHVLVSKLPAGFSNITLQLYHTFYATNIFTLKHYLFEVSQQLHDLLRNFYSNFPEA